MLAKKLVPCKGHTRETTYFYVLLLNFLCNLPKQKLDSCADFNNKKRMVGGLGQYYYGEISEEFCNFALQLFVVTAGSHTSLQTMKNYASLNVFNWTVLYKRLLVL